MRFAPEASQELYDAMDAGDWDKAHKIAVKYNFAIKGEATKYNKNKYVYYSRFYDGDIKRYETIRELSKALNRSFDAIRLRLARHSGIYWVKGPSKGYVIWQERAGLSDQPLRIPKPMKAPVTTKRKVYTYFLKQADGKVSEYQSANALAKALGRDRNSVYHYFDDADRYTWERGKLKGMSVWRTEV